MPFRLLDFHHLGLDFPDHSAKTLLCNFPAAPHLGRIRPHYPSHTKYADNMCKRFRLFPFRSPLLRESLLLSLPWGTKMFQFPQFASIPYVFRNGYSDITLSGFPHSGIPGSMLACSSPGLIAAYHALHRL